MSEARKSTAKTKCTQPIPTVRIISPLGKPLAWCPGCKHWKPAAQVPFGKELRRSGAIVASHAALAH